MMPGMSRASLNAVKERCGADVVPGRDAVAHANLQMPLYRFRVPRDVKPQS